MKTSDLYSIAIKLFGLYLIYLFIEHAFTYGYLVYNELENMNSGGSLNLGYLLLSISFLITGLFSIFKTDRIVKIVNKEDRKLEIGLTKHLILEVGISLFALILITYSSGRLLSYFIESTYFHNHKESEYLNHDRTRYIAQISVELVAGIFLLFNTRNFASRIIKSNEDKSNVNNSN